MASAARLIGLLIALQGMAGHAAPEFFLRLIQTIQTPPVIYAAALVRIAFGVVLLLAAPAARFPMAIRVIGALITLGGVLTPFYGVGFAAIVLGWWSQSSSIVRLWAAAALVLGLFIAFAVTTRRLAA